MTAASIGDRAIVLERVGKRYTKYEDQPMLATSLLNTFRRGKRSKLWAVRGVDLQLGGGETLGIIGRNGSGKSTLLQMVAGITSPTEGRVRVRGRIAPLISVGVGFHPELSGRDNLHVNGAILGLTRAEVNRRFDEVVEFAEMEKFIDTPVKFYSSGMIVRLGFSMAIHATPDVLIVDEVLAVGDIAFQIKCFDRMKAIREQGTTIIVVSHNMGAVRGLCERTVLMNQGEIMFDGDTSEAITKMHELLHARPIALGSEMPDDKMQFEADMAVVEPVKLLTQAGRSSRSLKFGERARIRFKVKALKDISKPFVAAVVISEAGVPIYGTTNREEPYPALKAGESATYDVVVPARLARGTYTIRPVFGRMAGRADERKLAMPEPLSFFIGGSRTIGVADPDATFEHK